jgi:predicted SprT family Zn-dependent metalloprotease
VAVAVPDSVRLREDPGLSAWCAELARGLGLPKLARLVRVAWNPRMRTTAGRAWWPQRSIELNPRLPKLGDDQQWRTLRHELAHLIAYERAGRRPIQAHGPEWRLACAELGIAGESPYHDLPFQRRSQQRRFAYVCPHCASTIRRVRRIRHPVACWTCCRKFSGGEYDRRFKLLEKSI